jgi:hypothetical protein
MACDRLEVGLVACDECGPDAARGQRDHDVEGELADLVDVVVLAGSGRTTAEQRGTKDDSRRGSTKRPFLKFSM